MKICAYCTATNRDEAIFCTRCKRPLQATPTRKDTSARNIIIWLLVVFILIGLSAYLFSSRFVPAPTAMPTPALLLNGMATGEPAPTRTQEPVMLSECVRDTTLHVRRGPGTQYETIGGLVSGRCFTILGRNEAATWVYIVSDDHQTGWVAASLLSEAENLSRVSVRGHSAPANSSRPTLTSAELAHGAQAYLTEVAATNFPPSSHSRYVMPCFATVDRIGDQISCKLEKAYCDYLPTADGSLTACNDRPYPDHTFTLIVLGEDWSDFDGQCLVVSGYLEINRGALQIQAFRRAQVSLCG